MSELNLKTTAPERADWREVYMYHVKHGAEPDAISAARLLDLLDDLDAALAALAQAEARAKCPECGKAFDAMCVHCYRAQMADMRAQIWGR